MNRSQNAGSRVDRESAYIITPAIGSEQKIPYRIDDDSVGGDETSVASDPACWSGHTNLCQSTVRSYAKCRHGIPVPSGDVIVGVKKARTALALGTWAQQDRQTNREEGPCQERRS